MREYRSYGSVRGAPGNRRLYRDQRKLVEEHFGWGKTIGGLRELHHRGRETVAWIFTFTAAAYDLVRLRTLIRVGVCP